MQTDLFGDLFAEEEVAELAAPSVHAERIAALPEKLRPRCEPALPVPTAGPALDEWTRHTQRLYLLYLVGACQRLEYRESSLHNVRYVLVKLNGLGGEW
ncbi:hypothetical protein P3T40_003458 [Paraburkholderia sp. EB58]|uniref:hypothetical protein n=1 Tax=Paraburkholderia sp. EB58 TaxID=3035125 RepID=UPI003D2228D4